MQRLCYIGGHIHHVIAIAVQSTPFTVFWGFIERCFQLNLRTVLYCKLLRTDNETKLLNPLSRRVSEAGDTQQ
jgi:hypothetical protein